VFSLVVECIESGAQILPGHELKTKLNQNILIFQNFNFNFSHALVLAMNTLATDSALGTYFVGIADGYRCIFTYLL